MEEYEEFREINGFPGYLVSDMGRIWSYKTNRYLKLCHHTDGYLMASLGKTKKVHILVAQAFLDNPENKACVDHIDGNIFNNELSNLRYATVSENQRNQKIRKNNTSKVKGVNYYKRSGKWQARIYIDGIRVSLGHFNTLEEAKQARVKKANEVFGVFTHPCEKL